VDNLKRYFLLDPGIHFLNHGSFGACPTPVFDSYQKWQRRLESQPVLFLGREHDLLLKESRAALGAALNVDGDDLVYVPNATHGVNVVARSLDLQPGDEVLSTDHEYGACDYTWQFVCAKTGAKYIRQPIDLPVVSAGKVVEQVWSGVTPRTRVIYLSHITSPTALRLPVEEVCRLARQQGILTIVDGAHAPGQIDLDLAEVGADFYTGNCHKWMLAPKGAAFLHARREVQSLVSPLVVSWGYGGNDGQPGTGSRFIDILQWTGTKDPSAALAVPDALKFMTRHNWGQVRRECRQLLEQAVERVCHLTGMQSLYPPDSDFYSQMAVAPLPAGVDLAALKSRLYDEHKVEVPLTQWRDRNFVRISVQAYNTQDDIDALVGGLAKLLPG
jgi:isopenicillin-N epimerase